MELASPDRGKQRWGPDAATSLQAHRAENRIKPHDSRRDVSQKLTQVFDRHVGLAQRHRDMELKWQAKLPDRDISGEKQAGFLAHAGLNPTSRAFERLAVVVVELGHSSDSHAAPAPSPHPATPYPDDALETIRAADPKLARHIESQSAELWARTGLSHRERIFASLAIDVAGGTLGQAFSAHARMALRAGITAAELNEAIRALAEYSTVKAWEATLALERSLRSLSKTHGGLPVFGDKASEPHTLESKVEVERYERLVLDQTDASGLAIVETRLVEKFTGGIVGRGNAKHLRLERPDGTGTLICYERIAGSVAGLEGSFLLKAEGVMEPGSVVHGCWEIVGSSGTGALQGVKGYAEFSAERDEGSPTGWRASTSLTYWLEPRSV